MKKIQLSISFVIVSLFMFLSSCSQREILTPAQIITTLEETTTQEGLQTPENTNSELLDNSQSQSTDTGNRNSVGGPWKNGGVIQIIEIGVENHRNIGHR